MKHDSGRGTYLHLRVRVVTPRILADAVLHLEPAPLIRPPKLELRARSTPNGVVRHDDDRELDRPVDGERRGPDPCDLDGVAYVGIVHEALEPERRRPVRRKLEFEGDGDRFPGSGSSMAVPYP